MILFLLNFVFLNLFSASWLVNTGAGTNYIKDLSTSGKAINTYSFNTDVKYRFSLLQNATWFVDLGSRLSYQNANREFVDASLSARSDLLVIEKVGISGLEAITGFGKIFKDFYQATLVFSIGLASIKYDGIINSSTLYNDRENALSFGFGMYNAFKLGRNFSIGPEFMYKVTRYVELNNLNILAFSLNAQWHI